MLSVSKAQRICCIAILIIFIPITSIAEDGAASVKVGPGLLSPGIDLKVLHDDNLLNAETAELETFGFIVSPHAAYEISDNIKKFVVDWSLEAGFYEDDRADSDEYVDNTVRAGFEYQPTDRFFAAINGEYKDTRDPRGTGAAEGDASALLEIPDEWHSYGIEGSLGVGAASAKMRVEGDVGHISKDYDTNTATTFVRDRDDIFGAARLFYRIAPKTSLLLEGRVINYDYEATAPGAVALNSDVYRVLAGVTWEATFKSTGSIKAGYIKKNFDASGRTDGDDYTWEVSIEWRPRTYSTVNISSSRDFQETNGAGDFIKSDNLISFDWTHDWLEHVKSVVNFSYTENSFDPSVRKDELLNAGVRLEYQMRRWLSLGAGYRYDERDSSEDAFDYERNVFEITVRITL